MDDEFYANMAMPGIPRDVALDIMRDVVPGGIAEEQTPAHGCYECGSAEFWVEAHLSFTCDALITNICDTYDEAYFESARNAVLESVDFISAQCKGCRRYYDWDADLETGVWIAHGTGDVPKDHDGEYDVVACPACEAEEGWKGVISDNFAVNEARLRRTDDGSFELAGFESVDWGIAGDSYHVCECRSCGESHEMKSSSRFTGWWVARHCRAAEPDEG